MRLVARWGVVVAGSAAGFGLAWWVCQELIGADEGISLGIAGAVLAILLAVAAWWAPRGADSEESDAGGRLVQKARAARDVYMAGRDMTVNQRHRDK
jgi:high-affinity Fe2+/Pb2+ permease